MEPQAGYELNKSRPFIGAIQRNNATTILAAAAVACAAANAANSKLQTIAIG